MTIIRTKIAVIALLIFLLSFSASCTTISDIVEKFSPEKKTTSDWSSELPPDFNLLVDAWKMVNKNYVDKDKLDAKKLSQGAVKGMIDALGDPHSAYVDPDLYKLEVSSLRGKYTGIGAYVGVRDKQLTIISPMVGSPAEQAGIKPGDKVLEINGKTTEGMSSTEAALTIQGPAGTSIKLLLLREGETKPFEVSIVRREITVKSVNWEKKDRIGYIQLTGFQQQTDSELLSALKSLMAEGVDGIVLDLRNNPGGLLASAVLVASQFIRDGVVVDVVDGAGNHSPERVRGNGVATDLPLVVLMNNGSASASEVVAGALQDYGRAKIAGKKSYGKGSVQMITNLKDGSALHLTVARWYTPKGRPIDGVGLTPDFPLELEGADLVDWAVNYLKNLIPAKAMLPAIES
jgi:carboxyl-terminal processing protease